MFVVVSCEMGASTHFECADVHKYDYVSLVSYSSLSKTKAYVVGDFVEKSLVYSQFIGLIGMSNVTGKHYIPINIRRNTLGISIVPEEPNITPPEKCKVILHFKTNK